MKSPKRTPRLGKGVGVLAVAALALAACGSGATHQSQAVAVPTGVTTITAWAHDGIPGENAALQAAVSDFNHSQQSLRVKLTLIPANNYTQTVEATPVSQLPDLLEMDGPTVASYVYAKKIQPIHSLLSAATLANLTASNVAQGTINGQLYAAGMYDSGLGIYGNKKLLAQAGVSYPTSLASDWTAAQFTQDLKILAAHNPQGKALDIKENYGLASEWGTYGFSPIVWSAGGRLIDLKTGKATGVLNAPSVVKAFQTFQSWMPYVVPNNNHAFATGQVALSWVGHWEYPTYAKALGSNLVLMPLPDFGNGPKSGQGSWTWGVTRKATYPKLAAQFLDALLSNANVGAMTTANGAPPGTTSALAASSLYRPGGPLHLFAQELALTCGANAPTPSCVTVPRPQTPGYPEITSDFSTALKNISQGANVRSQLDKAAQLIDVSFADNNNYSNN